MQVMSDTGTGKIRRTGYAWVLLVVFFAVLILVPAARALEPAWNYSVPDAQIGGVAVSPKGDLIAVGAGRVLFFSRDGTLLAQEPFGNDVRMTADGKYTASVYSTSVYYFENPVPSGSADQQTVSKRWDKDLSVQISSFEMNRAGSLIAGLTAAKNLYVLDTRNRIAGGNTEFFDSVLQISGGGIIGISSDNIHTYSSSGDLSRTEDIVTSSSPRFMVLPSDGSAVFNDGQAIRSVNIYNGTERWKLTVSGAVSSLSMAAGGPLIVAGTETGNIAGLDKNGNLSWSYASNPENQQLAGITCTAVSDKGTAIAAGTADGKILFLDSGGGLTGSYNADEYLRHIAMSADGSVVVATSDEHVYAFAPGSLPQITPAPSGTVTPVKNTPTVSPLPTTGSVASTPTPAITTPAEVPTTVIQTATQSPVSPLAPLIGILSAVFVFWRRRVR
jgi:hypothetical protein